MSAPKTKPRLHELPLGEREVKVDRKWAIRIAIILSILVLITWGITTVIFMMRKGVW